MSFIRTKDTIFEVVNENKKCLIVKGKRNSNKIYGKSKKCTNIVQQADTIEELCDAFVDAYNDGSRDIALLSDIYFFESYKSHIVYGAIWNDKGLIYVAKMNDKGELELL